jgi:hypothetical protein
VPSRRGATRPDAALDRAGRYRDNLESRSRITIDSSSARYLSDEENLHDDANACASSRTNVIFGRVPFATRVIKE